MSAHSEHRLPPLVGMAAALAAGSSLVALGAWALDRPTLAALGPGLVPMNPTSAVCILLAAVALRLSARPTAPRTRLLARACAAPVVGIGVLRLAAVALHWSRGVDQWLFGARLAERPGTPPVHMAPNTALAFLLLGTALLLAPCRGRRRSAVAQATALGAALLALLALLGYVYGARPFYGPAAQTPMALNTAISIFLLALATLVARPNGALAGVFVIQRAGDTVAWWLLHGTIATLAALGWLELWGHRSGLFDDRLGMALLVASGTILLSLIIWFGARRVRRLQAAQRLVHEELRQAHDQLELRVEARTAELTRALGTLSTLSRAVEQTEDLVFITDAVGRIEYANPRFLARTGYAREEVIGRMPDFLNAGEPEAGFLQALREAVAAGEVFRGTFSNLAKGGEPYQEERTLSPVRDEAGVVTHYVATGRDITGRLKLEEQLRQTQKMEAVGRLAGGVAHDFNNLLTAILGHAQLARRQLPPEAACANGLTEIERAARRASALTRQLLAFSRQQVLEPRPLDLNQVVREVEPMLQRLIGEDIELQVVFAPGLGHVLADRNQLDQVLVNLAVNARDAMPEGGRVTIETTAAEESGELLAGPPGLRPGTYVGLSVSDTGCGMDAETRARIFEPFFTTKPVGRGTGLGLSTVHGIVQQSGGQIVVYSEPGHGTTFKLYFPCVTGASAPESETAPPAQIPLGAETILVVEDEEPVRTVVGEALRTVGYRVLEASSPEEALDVLDLCVRGVVSIDLVLSDVVMPGMSVRELAERLRAAQPGLRILFMSGYTRRVADERPFLDSGAPFLPKPFTVDQLARHVRDALDQPPAAAA